MGGVGLIFRSKRKIMMIAVENEVTLISESSEASSIECLHQSQCALMLRRYIRAPSHFSHLSVRQARNTDSVRVSQRNTSLTQVSAQLGHLAHRLTSYRKGLLFFKKKTLRFLAIDSKYDKHTIGHFSWSEWWIWSCCAARCCFLSKSSCASWKPGRVGWCRKNAKISPWMWCSSPEEAEESDATWQKNSPSKEPKRYKSSS